MCEVPSETHVSNPCSYGKCTSNNQRTSCQKARQLDVHTRMLMQEMEGCDIGKDPDVDGVPTDSDKKVDTEVNLFVVNMNVQSAAYSCNLCHMLQIRTHAHTKSCVHSCCPVPGLCYTFAALDSNKVMEHSGVITQYFGIAPLAIEGLLAMYL